MMLTSITILLFNYFVQCNSWTSAKPTCNNIMNTSGYFHWLNEDGSLKYVSSKVVTGASLTTTNINCSEDSWQALDDYPNCKLCVANTTLICEGLEVYTLPRSSSLPVRNLTLYKMSGVGLIALPPRSFSNLTIGSLVIENSNLTYVSSDAFHGVYSIKSIEISNNTLDSLTYMDYLLKNINNLKELILKNNGLRILSSTKSANLKKLEYLSLAGNPIHNLDVFFLKNSSLKFLDLRNVQFKIVPSEYKESGFRSLPDSLKSVDLSGAQISLTDLQTMFKQFSGKSLTTVSLAYMSMTAYSSCEKVVVSLLNMKHSLEYLSLEGIWKTYSGVNLSNFDNKTLEAKFLSKPFKKLKELDLKNNNMFSISNDVFFKAFPNLQSLSLAGNAFTIITVDSLSVLKSLTYIDFRSSDFSSFGNKQEKTFKSLKQLDFSYSSFEEIGDGYKSFFDSVTHVETLSLCDCTIYSSNGFPLNNLKKLKYLDVSGTSMSSTDLTSSFYDLFTTGNLSIEELYFRNNDLSLTSDSIQMFSSLKNLKKLDLSGNLIKEIPYGIMTPSLEILNLERNFIGTWYSSVVSSTSKIKSLDLSDNQITFISSSMLEDFCLSSHVNINGNPLLCNSYVIDMVCSKVMNKTVQHNFTLVQSEEFKCYDINTGNQLDFSEADTCQQYYTQGSTYTTRMESSSISVRPTSTTPASSTKAPNYLAVYISGMVLIVLLISVIVAVNWWKIKLRVHRFLSMRRARLLKKEAEPLSKHQVQYDVFVSYSDVDRAWVLDHLVPNLEAEGDVSLCFHERDFQVGLGILENIIECMDRSHCLLLVISSAFVRSKWCQFEMHLAQYRLIETLRDQLVLVMLEDIPRKSRPQTLHHMMMTKTYLIWPQQPCKDDATELFWRRLKRALKPSSFYNIFTDS